MINTTTITNEDLAKIDSIVRTLSGIAYEWAPDCDEDLRDNIISQIDNAIDEFAAILEKITQTE